MREGTSEIQGITENRKLAYDNEFRAMLREHPGIVDTAMQLTEQGLKKYDPGETRVGDEGTRLKYDKKTGQWLEEKRAPLLRKGKIYQNKKGEWPTRHTGWKPMGFGRGTILVPGEPIRDENSGLEVTTLGTSRREMHGTYGGVRIDVSDYFKMSLNDDSYFVKHSKVTSNPAFTEFRNIKKAKELLADLDFVKVVDAKLGYQDNENSWYVSKWSDLERAGFAPYGLVGMFDDYVKGLERREFLGHSSEEDFLEAKKKFELIKERLTQEEIHRDLDSNLFYNVDTKTFILLDVTGQDAEQTLGQPFR